MDGAGDPHRVAELASFSVMRAVLAARREEAETTRAGIEHIVDDLEQRLGRAAIVALVGGLAGRALWPFEQQAQQCGTTVAAELDADEQRVLAMLDQHRRYDQ